MFFRKRKEEQLKKEVPFKQIPKGWFVYEMGQSPVHFLWFCHLVNFNSLVSEEKKVQSVFVEECNSPDIAIIEAIEKIKNNDISIIIQKDE